MNDQLKKVTRVTRIESAPNTVKIGDWFWAQLREYDWEESKHITARRLACVIAVGSNYVELEAPNGTEFRVHFDHFDDQLEAEPNPQAFIDGRIKHHAGIVNGLLTEIKELTAALSIPIPGNALPEFVEHGETAALARTTGKPIEDYKAALIKAQKEQLPKLFERVKKENERVAMWMKATLIPLLAQAQQLKPIIDAIKGRIFNVELYAGLKEWAECIREGDAAPMTEPIHVFQRRHYMDEECLANYKVGGMEFSDLHQFDAWLCADENRTRVLPFPRSIVAFKVRRERKHREGVSFSDFIEIHFKEKQDELTFLYIRNGEQVWRVNTSIEFDAQLFPDERDDDPNLTGTVYAHVYHGDVKRIVSEGHYLSMVQAEKDSEAEYERELAEWTRVTTALKAQGKTSVDDEWPSRPYHSGRSSFDSLDDYHPFTHDSVYYDDIKAFFDAEIEKKNRMVLVLQGLIDRSPVLHPHPPTWQLWKPEGFNAAIRLVYDDSRGLTPGDAPDWETYRAQLNMSLREGSITVGQDEFWTEVEAARENARRANDWRRRREYDRDLKNYRPHGNKGPGELAAVVSLKKGGARFTWRRRPRNEGYYGKDRPWVDDAITVPLNRLLNVSAYTPGDYRMFFNDPRTRAKYLDWAPYLLLAEEYYAGNRTPGRKVRLVGKPSGWRSETTVGGVTVVRTSDDEDAEEWAAREGAN